MKVFYPWKHFTIHTKKIKDDSVRFLSEVVDTGLYRDDAFQEGDTKDFTPLFWNACFQQSCFVLKA